MKLTDLHVHTTYCHGQNTPEELVLAAIDKNMECIGFSSHSYTAFDGSYCMKKQDIQAYKDEITALKEKYKGKIKILLGIEQDFYSEEPTDDYDYVIGSVHYLKVGNDYISIDESPEILKNAVKRYYDGDFYKLTSAYFETVAKIKNADIIGHFDLITKFNEGYALFDEQDSRYMNAYKKAIDILLKLNVPFEINTGVISRGYKNAPYPSREILAYIKEHGGKTILSSDCHFKSGLAFEFEKYQSYLF